jgi:hypothetical protein
MVLEYLDVRADWRLHTCGPDPRTNLSMREQVYQSKIRAESETEPVCVHSASYTRDGSATW